MRVTNILRCVALIIEVTVVWRLWFFGLHSFDQRVETFVDIRKRVLSEATLNCETLTLNFLAFEAACGSDNSEAPPSSMCRGVYRIRDDARACTARIASEKELIATLSLLTFFKAATKPGEHPVDFYRHFLEETTVPRVCKFSKRILCVDWIAVTGVDLVTGLFVGFVPFSNFPSSLNSLFGALVSFSAIKVLVGTLQSRIHKTIRKLRSSKTVFILFPLEYATPWYILWVFLNCVVLISAFSTSYKVPGKTLLFQIILSIHEVGTRGIAYFFTTLYILMLLITKASSSIDHIRTRLSLEELQHIDADIIRLWSECGVSQLDRLSDAGLLEYLIRVDLSHIQSNRNEVLEVLKRRAFFKILVNECDSVRSLCTGDLQVVSQRLSVILATETALYWRSGLLVGFVFVSGFLAMS